MNEEKNTEEMTDKDGCNIQTDVEEITEEETKETEATTPTVTDEDIVKLNKKSKKTKRIIIIVFAASLVLLLVCAMLPGLFTGDDEEYRTYPPIDPSKLYETKEEDFDIMEYEEYLKLDRNVYFLEGGTENYTKNSIDAKSAEKLGEEVKLIYDIIGYLIDGDVESYNSSVASGLRKDDFTQQQIYSITLRRSKPNAGESYEYVMRVEYKIHENNGSYRNNILPDASRYQLFCMERVNGKLTVTAIVEPYYEEK